VLELALRLAVAEKVPHHVHGRGGEPMTMASTLPHPLLLKGVELLMLVLGLLVALLLLLLLL
jgi:hypothetical protein